LNVVAYVALPDQELAFVIQIPPLAIFLRLISEGADVPFEEVVPVMMLIVIVIFIIVRYVPARGCSHRRSPSQLPQGTGKLTHT